MSGWLIVWAALNIALPVMGLATQPESEPSSPARTPAASIAPLDELGRGTPRGTVAGFLDETKAHRYRRAAAYLDLRRMPPQEAADRGADLAHKLRAVLDNTVLDLEALSDEPEGRQDAGLPRARQLVARIETEHGPVSILLERVRRDDGVLIWQFSQATVANIPNLYWTLSYGIVGEWLPPVLIETRLLGLALWQWIGLAVLIGAALLIAHLLVRPAMPLTRWLMVRWGMKLEDPNIGRAVGPVRLLVALAVFRAGRAALWLPASVLPIVTGIERFLLIIVLAWFALRLIEVTGFAARRRLLSRNETATLPIVDVGLRALKIGLSVLAALMLLQALGVQVSALIAAVGVGGIGLALAAQRTVENLFGGLAVIGDQPVVVGDFCRFGDRQGTVERIGLWSTRVRTQERSVVSIPNAQFFTLQVENLARRDRILFNPTLRLRLETKPDQLRWLLVKIREMLYAHPRIDPVPARVRLIGFGQSSIDIEIFCYLLTTSFEEAMGVREDVCLRMLDLIAAAGTALAPPSQISYSGGDGFDRERAAAAAAEVEGWRRDGQLPLPEFSEERVKSLRGTLDYPPVGSSRRTANEAVPDNGNPS